MNKTKDLVVTLNEMAEIDVFNQVRVRVYSRNHGVHLETLDNKLVAKIKIPMKLPKNISELDFIEKGSSYKKFLITKFIEWLGEESSNPNYSGTHLGECIYAWGLLHPFKKR